MVALGAGIIGTLLVSKTVFGIDRKIAAAREEARPAIIKVMKIIAPQCANCFVVDEALAELKKQNVSIKEEQELSFDAPEAQSLIQKLEIKRVPTYIAVGEASKKNLEGFVKANGRLKDGAFVFDRVTPIFIDTATKKETGFVAVTTIGDPSCRVCAKPQALVQSLAGAGVKIGSSEELVWNSVAGQKLIEQYKIKSVPTVLLSSDLNYYDDIKAAWLQRIGTEEQDGVFVAREIALPYRDIGKNKITGWVDIVYVTDAACKDCYKPQETHKNILTQGMGVALKSERTVDAGSAAGQALIKKYKLAQIPTILLSPDAADYSRLKSVWPQVGTVEPDGWYVFRKMDQVGPVVYKDLSANKIVRPQQNSSDDSASHH